MCGGVPPSPTRGKAGAGPIRSEQLRPGGGRSRSPGAFGSLSLTQGKGEKLAHCHPPSPRASQTKTGRKRSQPFPPFLPLARSSLAPRCVVGLRRPPVQRTLTTNGQSQLQETTSLPLTPAPPQTGPLEHQQRFGSYPAAN